MTDYSIKSAGEGNLALLKDKHFIDFYRDLIRSERPKRIVELGYFQGGMPLFLRDMIGPSKIVSMERNECPASVLELVDRKGLSNDVKFFSGVDQGDGEACREILDRNFESTVDLIIDDCSHFYEQSKVSFESLFGYLQPGGKYVIEDWGWTHWAGKWQTDKSPFHGQPSLTNLIFEIIAAAASVPGIISGVNVVSPLCVCVTRGADLAPKQRLNLAELTRLAGRSMLNIQVPKDLEPLL